VIGWGAAIAAFGLVGANLPVALLFLAIAGAADVVSAIFRSTILQVTVPDRLRGRLSGIFSLASPEVPSSATWRPASSPPGSRRPSAW
jgi:hypothetical protein